MATARSLPLTSSRIPRAGLARWVLDLAPSGGSLIIGLVLAAPLVMLIVNSFNVAPVGQPARYGLANWTAAFSDPTAFGALINSLELALTRTSISLPIALGLTWLITRSDMPGRSLVELLCWVSIFIPILPLTFGWVLLLGKARSHSEHDGEHSYADNTRHARKPRYWHPSPLPTRPASGGVRLGRW